MKLDTWWSELHWDYPEMHFQSTCSNYEGWIYLLICNLLLCYRLLLTGFQLSHI